MRSLLLFPFIISTAFSAVSQTQSLSNFIDAYCETNKFHGTVLVYSAGKVQYEKSFGLANMPFGIANTTSTKFKIASITKLFTSVLIMQLHERGKIGLTNSIADYLPEYKGAGARKVTVRQLLNHTSGIENMDTVTTMEAALTNGIPAYQRPLTVDRLLEEYCSGPLVHEPGKVFDYNNADYVILGKIIEKLSGKPYWDTLKENILDPLGMRNSGFRFQRDIVPGLADTYFYREDLKRIVPDLPVYGENWHASGSMYSTAGDLLEFAKALFGLKLLKQSSLDQMFESGLGEYGFGTWVYRDYDIGPKRYTVVKRPGRIMGAQGVLFHVLGTDATVIILSNVGTVSIDDFVAAVAQRLTL